MLDIYMWNVVISWQTMSLMTWFFALCLVILPGCKEQSRPARNHEGKKGTDDAGLRRAASPQEFASAAQALEHLLATRPRIIGFGEFHQTTGAAPVRSTMEHFIEQLDVVSKGATDLIVETWVEDGKCGTKEEVVSNDVREVTQRPPATENHLLTLLSGAKERGVNPHLLTMECEDYEYVTAAGGEVDYEKMLVLIKRKLTDKAGEVWRRQKDRGKGTILIYGGALHNDIHPHSGLEDTTYAAEVMALAGDGYMEIDLYVPELIAENPLLMHEPWYPEFASRAAPDRVLLFERSPRSYILILPKGAAAL